MIKPCVESYMLAEPGAMGMRRNWFPRIVSERFLTSTRDGEIKRSPDPVTAIEGDLTWFNNSPDDQDVFVQVLRAPRTVVAQNPNTVIIHDAWSWAVGVDPTADYPSVMQDTMGGKLQIDRPETAPADIRYGRFFFDFDACQAWVAIGVVPSMQLLHFRYIAAFQTPGVWTAPSEYEPRWEANARWARLLAFATPVGSM
jgi:hypothetical protein